ncbi:MAG: helix-turn-helix domain-containing protein [Planctomycetota bacterium]
MDSAAIGRKIGRLREKMGMTTTELATRVGISQAQISRLENGKQGFRSNTLLRISEALDVKPVYFFLEDEPTERADEQVPVYGLAAGGELVKALRSPEFVRLAEDIAGAFFHRKDAFAAIKLATKAILGEKRVN